MRLPSQICAHRILAQAPTAGDRSSFLQIFAGWHLLVKAQERCHGKPPPLPLYATAAHFRSRGLFTRAVCCCRACSTSRAAWSFFSVSDIFKLGSQAQALLFRDRFIPHLRHPLASSIFQDKMEACSSSTSKAWSDHSATCDEMSW
ncbi:uncharacterized protein LOC112344061 [Selaginella moellendorffii]|uniref:uncharacterized protein LOC112344061 n=1 Tax=Selaginella moellendorffii TaxID=88036 RepID=UPI000D1CAE69|nr:uncharacterized protein LOC112344061 [Selaginella moellendorffii]|eukprot:XP_024523951.1 uncharacterized protein LOC112344061 [Selaginella moellendorffii]